MKLRFAKIVLSIAAIGAVACSSDIDSIVEKQPVAGDVVQPGEVRIAVPEGTRSSIVEDVVNGEKYGVLRWDSSDEISILAYDSNDNSIVMSPTQFKFVGSKENGNGSYFTAIPNLSNMTADGTYNYYAISPSLEAANKSLNRPTLDGSKLSFTIPQKQDGQFRADMDLMIAKAAGKPALEACVVIERDEEGEIKDATRPINNLDLMFYHRTHILHFTIPEAAVNNLGKDIKKVYLFFPDAVVGTLSVDIKNNVTYDTNNGITSPVPTYSNTNNKITVEFKSPKRVGDDFWVMTLPHVGGMENIDIRFEDVDGNVSQRRQVTFANMSANRVTPINVQTIPAAAGVTSFYYTVGTNNLGESLTSMNITLPNGCYFTNFEQTGKAKKGNDNKYIFSIFNDMLDAVENQTLPFELESKHALIPQTIDIPNLVDNSADNNLGSKDVPYLLFEDFKDLKSFEYNDKYDKGTDRNVTGHLLNDKMPAKGWNVARAKGVAGKCIRLNARYQSVFEYFTGQYIGRLDTPYLSYIKPNVSVRLKVQYEIGNYVPKASVVDDRKQKNAYYVVDIHNQSIDSAIDGIDIDLLNGGSMPTGVHKSEPFESKFGDSFDGDFDSTEIFISNCTSQTRITWYPATKRTSGGILGTGNANYYFYIDDIKVQIAN